MWQVGLLARGGYTRGTGLDSLAQGSGVPTFVKLLGTLPGSTQTSVGVRLSGAWQQPPGKSDGKVRTVRARAELCNPLQKTPAAGEELLVLPNPLPAGPS